jgi:hypothetical protein
LFVVAIIVGLLTNSAKLFAEDPTSQPPDKLSLASGDHILMTYNAGFQPSPNPSQPWYGRSGFIHPVLTPSGRVVTDGFPQDHLHQHGLMFAWTSAEFQGEPIDFWNSHLRQGHVEHVQTVHVSPDRIIAKLRHVSGRGDKPVTILNETWELTRVSHETVPHETMHVFDLRSVQNCAIDEPLEIKQYHYGSLCVRGPAAWLDQTATMITSDGKHRVDGNHSRCRWVAMQGEIEGQTCGIAVIGHDDNFRAPQPVRLHPDKPYFSFAPMVLGEFRITPGTPYESRFRFVAFDGSLDRQKIEQLADSFSEQ